MNEKSPLYRLLLSESIKLVSTKDDSDKKQPKEPIKTEEKKK